MRKLPALILAAAALGGCMKVTYLTGNQPSGPSYEEKTKFYLFGLLGEETVDIARICPQGVASWQSRTEVTDWLLSCITCSIYTPQTVEVKCAGGGAYLLEPDADRGVTWVTEVPSETVDTVGGAG